jgi:hypothetical protein
MAVPADTVKVSTGCPLNLLEIASANDGEVPDDAVAARERLVGNTTACLNG